MRPHRALLPIVLGLLLAAPARAEQACGGLLPLGLLSPTGGFSLGCTRVYTLKLGASLGTDGNYILLDLPACASGPCAGLTAMPQLQCAASQGYGCCLAAGQHVPTLQGINVATLVAGLNQRIARDTDARSGICFETYLGNGARLVRVATADFPGTVRSEMVLSGFLGALLVSPPAGSGTSTTVTLEFLDSSTPARPTSWGRVKQLYR